ncbi:kinase-like domain-containing protein [Xylariaceae sp. FL1019]|nr:kinase-like domain-containing protein [Xylariaceae sp. FL1019]
MFEVEELSQYSAGGYHPVHLNEVILDKYQVIHKLGHGENATVWLCWHKNLRDWVAVKMYRADRSRPNPDLEALRTSSSFNPVEWSDAGIILPVESFWLEGVNGEHLGEVYPVLGSTLGDRWKYDMKRDELPVLKEYLHQAASCLGFLHEKGFVHGQFRPQNIHLQLDNLAYIEKDELIELIGQPKRVYVDHNDAGLQYTVVPARLEYLCVKNKVAITGFKASPEVVDSVSVPLRFVSPEVVFQLPSSSSADLWPLILAILEVRADRSIFPNTSLLDIDGYILGLEGLMGPMPEPYRTILLNKRAETQGAETQGLPPPVPPRSRLRGKAKDGAVQQYLQIVSDETNYKALQDHYEECASRLGHSDRFEIILAETKDHRGDPVRKLKSPFTNEEIATLADLLRGVLKWQPDERLNIDAILGHEWLEDRALEVVRKGGEAAGIEKRGVGGEASHADELINILAYDPNSTSIIRKSWRLLIGIFTFLRHPRFSLTLVKHRISSRTPRYKQIKRQIHNTYEWFTWLEPDTYIDFFIGFLLVSVLTLLCLLVFASCDSKLPRVHLPWPKLSDGWPQILILAENIKTTSSMYAEALFKVEKA